MEKLIEWTIKYIEREKDFDRYQELANTLNYYCELSHLKNHQQR